MNSQAAARARFKAKQAKEQEEVRGSPYPGLVYLIHQVGSCLHKIGYTEGSIERRRHLLGTGNASPLVVLGTRPGSMVQEKALHKLYTRHQVDREWFDFSDPNVLAEVIGLFRGSSK